MILGIILTNQNAHYEKGLSKHEKDLSDLNYSKTYKQFITKGYKFMIIVIIMLIIS